MAVEIILVAVTGVLTACYFLYTIALPKSLPGIPYKKESAERLMGDIPDMLADIARDKNINLWWRDSVSFSSPISQMFLDGPFSNQSCFLRTIVKPGMLKHVGYTNLTAAHELATYLAPSGQAFSLCFLQAPNGSLTELLFKTRCHGNSWQKSLRRHCTMLSQA